jgi:hypothetical protein
VVTYGEGLGVPGYGEGPGIREYGEALGVPGYGEGLGIREYGEELGVSGYGEVLHSCRSAPFASSAQTVAPIKQYMIIKQSAGSRMAIDCPVACVTVPQFSERAARMYV